jgi:hypothetical protein
MFCNSECHSRVALTCAAFPRLVDLSSKTSIFAVLSDSEKKRVAAVVGPFMSFDPDCCSGRYRLDLSEPYQRLLARTLQACGNTENVRASRLGLADTSASGNRQRIVRNVTLNGAKVDYSGSWVIPEVGVLQVKRILRFLALIC